MSPVPKKTLHRRTIPAPPGIEEYIHKVLETSNTELPTLLNAFDRWTYPKGDLFQWTDVLNKCDSILEELCLKYELKVVQKTPFHYPDKALLLAILRFSVFLLDHCANRSLYASSNNISSLLVTTDLDVLEQVCRITLRLAQRASHQRSGKGGFLLSQDKLWKLASSLQYATREHGTSNIPMDKLVGKDALISSEWTAMRFTYHQVETMNRDHTNVSLGSMVAKTPPSTTTGSSCKESLHHASSSVPREHSRVILQANEGIVNIEIPAAVLAHRTLEQNLADVLESSQPPTEHHFELMLRLRFALNVSSRTRVHQLVHIRVLALASLAYIVPETILQARLLSMESNLVHQLAKLVHPDSGISRAVRTSAFAGLEAIAHHRSRLGDVLNVLGASINHGLLMYSFRNLLTNFEIESAYEPMLMELVDAQISLLHFLSTTNIAGSMLCAAGLVQTLTSVIENKNECALRVLVKSINLLDHLLYGFQQAFQIFCDCGGLQTLIRRIEAEIHLDLSTAPEFILVKERSKIDYAMTHERFSLLKTMLKFIVHMMQTSGTAEGLRNLVETRLPFAMKMVYDDTAVFGASIFASTTNILATFIHNEPSSYQVLNEIELPELFLKSVATRVMPSSEAMTAIPNAFGAICLNTQGLQLFNDISPLLAFLQIFTSPRHCETLRESDIAGVLGSSIDELVRHHPSLKVYVSRGLLNVLQQIHDLGNSSKDYTSRTCRLSSSDKSVKNQNIDSTSCTFVDEDGVDRLTLIDFIDATARFLEGYLQNPNHVRHFVADGGVNQLIDLYDLPCLPYDFAKTHAALSLSHVLRLSCENNPQSLLNSAFLKMKQVIHDLQDFLTYSGSGSYIQLYLDGGLVLANAEAFAKNLSRAHALSALLSDMYAAPLLSHSRSTVAFFQTFSNDASHTQMLLDLGALHRRIVWEEIKLSMSLPTSWLKATKSESEVPVPESMDSKTEVQYLAGVEDNSPQLHDVRMLRSFLSQIPQALIPFFQGLSRMLIGRRTIDLNQRTIALRVADSLAQILDRHLSWDIPSDADSSSRQSYYLMMLTVARMILCDERGHSSLMTSILIKFDSGIDHLLLIMSTLWADAQNLWSLTTSIDVTKDSSADAAHSEQARVSGALQLLFHLLQQLTSSKVVLESPQTIQLDSKDRNRDRPGFFHPGDFLRGLRTRILPTVAQILHSDMLRIMPTSALGKLIVVLTQCVSMGQGTPFKEHSVIGRRGVSAVPDFSMEDDDLDDSSSSPKDTNPTMDLTTIQNLRASANSESLQLTENDDVQILTESIMKQSIVTSLKILKCHADLIFELAEFVLVSFSKSVSKDWIHGGITSFVEALQEPLSVAKEDSNICLNYAAISHLLARLSHDDEFLSFANNGLTDLTTAVLRMLEKDVLIARPDFSRGFCNLVVFYDNLIAYQDHSRIRHALENSPAVKNETHVVEESQTRKIFEATVILISRAEDKVALVSLLRFLVRITRSQTYSDDCKKGNTLDRLLSQLRSQASQCDQNVKVTLIVFLRHLVEDQTLLLRIMQHEIRTWFKTRSRDVDISTFVKQNSSLALRSPELFVECSQELCCLPKYDANTSLQAIALREPKAIGLDRATDGALASESTANLVSDKSSSFGTGTAAQSNGVIHSLLKQLQACSGVQSSDSAMDKNLDTVDADLKKASGTSFSSSLMRSDSLYLHKALIMQCISELLTSYRTCKVDFITYDDHTSISDATVSGTSQIGALHLFMHQLIYQSYNTTGDSPEIGLQDSSDQLFREIFIGLCADTGLEEDDDTISEIRKMTINTLHKVLIDLIASDSTMQTRYRQLLALADLVQSLLTSHLSANNQAQSSGSQAAHKEIAKLMIERQFTALLTQALSEIDLLFLGSKKVTKAILRALRSLTKLSIRMDGDTKTSVIEPDFGRTMSGQSQCHDFSESDVEHNSLEQREETPDFYRNSALGMFGTELHESEDSGSSDEDDEMTYEDGLEFEEDGSETGSAVSDEDLDLGGEVSDQQHAVELILENDVEDSDESMSDESSGLDSSLSGEVELIEGDGVESDWNVDDESQEVGIDDMMPGSSEQDRRLEADGDAFIQELAADTSEGPSSEDGEGALMDEGGLLLLQNHGLDSELAGDEERSWDWMDISRQNPVVSRRLNDNQRLWTTIGSHGRLSNQALDSHVQVFRRPRLHGAPESLGTRSQVPILSNPLMSRPETPPVSRQQPEVTLGNSFSDWIESIEALIGGGAVQLIGDIMRRQPGNQGRNRGTMPAIRVEVSGTHSDLIPAQMTQLLQRVPSSGVQTQAAHRPDLLTVANFEILPTIRRYQDESVILYSSKTSEEITGIVGQLLEAMAPAERVGEQSLRDSVPLSQMSDVVIQDAQNLSEAQAHEPASMNGAQSSLLEPSGDVETSQRIDGPSIDATEHHQNTDHEPSQTVRLRGQIVDISGLGVDMEFLEALPEEMREEVLTQHIRERRASAQVAHMPTTELTPEFLEALPLEIRAELMQQEAADRNRHERLARRSNPQIIPTGPLSDLDPASFLASLDPALRQSILVEQDDAFLDQLPPEMLAEISHGRLQNSNSTRNPHSNIHRDSSTGVIPTLVPPKGVKASRKHEAIQLLDKAGVAALLRLVFLPAPHRTVLHDVLLNLCENRVNRAEILGQLINILQEGNSDVHAAERCFLSLTKRSRAPIETNRSLPRRVLQISTIESMSPALITLQSLQALTFLIKWNEQLPSYFLTEHDVTSIRKAGKGKDKMRETSKAARYPINAIMMLLDRASILQDQEVLELLAHLISTISRPLLLLAKPREAEAEAETAKRHQNGKPLPDDTPMAMTDADQSPTQSPAKKARSLTPPEVPAENLRCVINIITADACSGKTFQHTLATIHHLTALEGAHTVISEELLLQAQNLVQDLRLGLRPLKEAIEEVHDGSEIHESILTAFSSRNSLQAKLLRLLKTIDYLSDDTKRDRLEHGVILRKDSRTSIYDCLRIEPLWAQLSECLTSIHQKSTMIHVATVLLPLIEALMVICKNATIPEYRGALDRQATHDSSDARIQQFFTFTEEHKKILNQMVRNNPGLMSGSFALLTKNPKVLEFDNKRNFFTRKLRDRGQHKDHYPSIHLNVRRDAVFLDSYKELHFKSGDEIKYSKLIIRFSGEEGVDAGGVSREWFQVLARQMFDPNYALFVPVNADRNTYHPNKTSGINPEHLLFFKFVGRIVGKALFDGKLLDCHFSRPIYKKILGKNVSLKDMETLDLEYYKSLVWMLDNDITDVITETFSVERDDFGVINTIDLIPGGRGLAVTEQNKQDYIAKVTEYRLLESVSDQLEHFMIGFNEVIPPDLIAIFNEQEVELLISGLPDIDVDDWKNNTEYHNYSAASPQIQWFWRTVRTFDDEERARLLQFCTASSRIPIEGFAHLEGMHGVQKFSIHRDYSHGSRLPQSHTCFNQLDLPEYESYEVLRSSLLTAISEGSEGFGFA